MQSAVASSWFTASPRGEDTLRLVNRVAKTGLSVYLAGETGVGKEVLAHLIHTESSRADGPFVPLHCAALPLTIAESELFGHVRGAFTGAVSGRPGALLQANGGTLFLDEVADLPLEIQVKLLRFLECGEIRPVGADRIVYSNVRLICATHQDLSACVENGRFRRDLYYRLASVQISIPALRERREDIVLLARHFGKLHQRDLSRSAIRRLCEHPWHGNVRELKHAIERAASLAPPDEERLREGHFDFLARRGPSPIDEAPIVRLAEMEKTMILRALRAFRGNRGLAADALGIARSTLFVMLRRHGLEDARLA